jgi:predicted DNA-binding transcriptional regulator AlpA
MATLTPASSRPQNQFTPRNRHERRAGAAGTTHVNPQAMLRLPQVLELVPIGASAWWQGVKSGRFPAAIKLGPRTTVWRASDILRLTEGIDRD